MKSVPNLSPLNFGKFARTNENSSQGTSTSRIEADNEEGGQRLEID
jgi:hypothetical protein